MHKRPAFVLAMSAVGLGLLGLLFGCETDGPTEASIANEFPSDEPAPFTVVKVWYKTTLFLEPLPPGQESEPARVATGPEPVYALLARVPSNAVDAGAPRLVVARTRDEVTVPVGEQKRIVLSPTTTLVGCGGPGGLSRANYDDIAKRIFPGDAVEPFDPAGCTVAPLSRDAGGDSSGTASVDASGAD